jgi:hypothetical protein
VNTIRIESASVESVKVTFKADADPTGDDIEFLVTASTATSPSGSWVAGTWGTWANGIVVATTPTLGAAGAAIELTEDTTVTLWCRVAGAVIPPASIRILVT